MKKYFSGDWFADLFTLEGFLEELEFYKGTERKRMLKQGGIKINKNQGSMLYGVTWKSYLTPTKKREYCEETGLYKTKIYAENPHLKDIFKEFQSLYFPDFKWNQLQLNKSYPCPPHIDSQNVGTSVLVSLGNYTGGLTCVYDPVEKKINRYDCREKPIKFNGSELLHWVEPFEGTRYSIVFYRHRYKRVKDV